MSRMCRRLHLILKPLVSFKLSFLSLTLTPSCSRFSPLLWLLLQFSVQLSQIEQRPLSLCSAACDIITDVPWCVLSSGCSGALNVMKQYWSRCREPPNDENKTPACVWPTPPIWFQSLCSVSFEQSTCHLTWMLRVCVCVCTGKTIEGEGEKCESMDLKLYKPSTGCLRGTCVCVWCVL